MKSNEISMELFYTKQEDDLKNTQGLVSPIT